MSVETLASFVALVGSLSSIGYIWYKARDERRNLGEQANVGDADASIKYSQLASASAERLLNLEKTVDENKTAIAELKLSITRLNRFIAYQSGIIRQLSAQLVSHGLTPVVEPKTLEDFDNG